MKLRKSTKQLESTVQPKLKTKPKSFDECFQECIRNKTIPADTPPYLRKALE